MSAVDEMRTGAPGMSGQHRRAGQPRTAVPTAIAPQALAHIRTAGLTLPLLPGTGGRWIPQTRAEQHLLREGRRLDQVRQLLLGEIGRLRHIYAGEQPQTHSRAEDCPLTSAELKVLAGAAAGETPRETAARLHLAHDTVRTQRQLAQKRLDARSIPHAVALAVAGGWISGEQLTGGTAP